MKDLFLPSGSGSSPNVASCRLEGTRSRSLERRGGSPVSGRTECSLVAKLVIPLLPQRVQTFAVSEFLEQHLSSVPARPAGCSVRVSFEILPTPNWAQAKECFKEPQQRTKFKSNVTSISAKFTEQPYKVGCCSHLTSTVLPGQSAKGLHFSLFGAVNLRAWKKAPKLCVIGYVCQ